MTKTTMFLVLVGTSGLALADHVNTGISIPGWSIETSENLYLGSTHTSYPLLNLIDGRPETAWVFSGKKISEQSEESGAKEYGITITPDKPVLIDGLRLMNGYNKSEQVFHNNDRIVEIKVYDSSSLNWTPKESLVKTAILSDKMGWHSITLPRRKYESLTIVFSGIRKGPESDICVSELQLTTNGRPLAFGDFKAYTRTNGDECG